MELREFAEQVLFSSTLEEKLHIPRSVTDKNPGSPLAAPRMPGRPPKLVFKATGAGRNAFPGLHRLEQETERGRLLHFFANHELLATELMALALLRFPDAPPAFRQGVFATLKDEQRHTRLYLMRMETCGVQFGELPVSGYFWRSISGMENPIDYVAGLSLTFEQANLDFCRHYADGFFKVGDAAGGRLLDRIYHDEIGHVAYGLKWFRRWKNPDSSDWEAFCRHLKFPLSPQRAKGLGFNREGRRAAGLDIGFIDELEVYSQSRGRTPTVSLFNPLAEALMTQAKGFTPTQRQRQLVDDLGNLPQFLARQDDIVLVRNRPSTHFLASIRRAGFPLPEFVELAGKPADLARRLDGRKLGSFRPWAWGPDSVEWLQPLDRLLGPEARRAGTLSLERIRHLYSKSWSAGFLRSVLERSGNEPWLCPVDDVGQAVTTIEAALDLIRRMREGGFRRLVVKQSHGLAGRNSLRLWEPEPTENQRKWMEKYLSPGGELVIEPWLERVIDFSIQLEAGADRLRLLGFTGLINDARGHYRGNWAEARHVKRLPSGVLDSLRPFVGDTDRLRDLFESIRRRLEPECRSHGYEGPVGIDAFVYRAEDSGLRLKPVVEINPRFTMGRLTLELMKQVCPGRNGLFRILSRTEIERAGHASVSACAEAIERRFPITLEGSPKERISSGALCLNDPETARERLAVFAVGKDLEELAQLAP